MHLYVFGKLYFSHESLRNGGQTAYNARDLFALISQQTLSNIYSPFFLKWVKCLITIISYPSSYLRAWVYLHEYNLSS